MEERRRRRRKGRSTGRSRSGGVAAIRKRKKKKKRRKRKRKRRKKKCAKLTRKTREAFGYSQPTIIPSRKMNHPVDRLSRYVDGEIEATERRCLASETAGAAT